jgi:hypothetical protein
VAADTVVCTSCSESVLRTAYSVHLPLCTGPAHDASAHADNDNDDAMNAAASEVSIVTAFCCTEMSKQLAVGTTTMCTVMTCEALSSKLQDCVDSSVQRMMDSVHLQSHACIAM